MSKTQLEEKRAVESGYWNMYRFNPSVADDVNPFTLDSKDPTASYQDFIGSETRYSSLLKARPAIAAELFERAESDAAVRLATYKNKASK